MPFRYIFPAVLLFFCAFKPNSVDRLMPVWLAKASFVNSIDLAGKENIDRSGVDFTASGGKSEWTLNIDFSHLIHFYSAQTGSVYMPVPVPVADPSNGKVHYTASDGTGQLQIVLQAVACEENTAAYKFTYRVEVGYKGRTYAGCGYYLFPAERLHDIWALELLNQRKISASAFTKGIPTLEIFVLEQKIIGNTGCNAFSGQVIIEKDNIRFKQLTATEMACPGSLEKELLQAFAAADTYRTESGKLIISKGKTEILRFKKVD